MVVLRDQEIIDGEKKKTDIDYDDTSEIVEMRDMLLTYNDLLASAEIAVELTEAEQVDRKGNRKKFNFASRRVRRIFNRSSFKLGGRFWGGWWQRAGKDIRKRIYINDNPVVEYDYGATNVHLLYSLVGENYHELFGPDDDPYTLARFHNRRRSILKSALLVGLGADGRKAAKGAIRKKWREDFSKEEYEGIDLDELLDAIIEKHPKISDHLFTDCAPMLQRMESDLCESVIRQALEQGIVVLTVHDSFVVEIQYEDFLIEAMRRACEEVGLMSQPPIDPV